MKRLFLILMLFVFSVAVLLAQPLNPNNNNDVIKVNYQKKSVPTALLLSLAVPGAGQFYADRHSITAYIFPLIEIGLWVGNISYNSKADDKEEAYKKFADEHYNRAYYAEVRDKMIAVNEEDIYSSDFFHLDTKNSQHYYEDIGKYDKYIFGWTDWYEKYADPDNGNIQWSWSSDNSDHVWLGNYPTDPAYASQSTADSPADGSPFRKHYIGMRNDAEQYYSKADVFTTCIMFNHILSGLDAVRVARHYNSNYLSQVPPVDINLRTVCMNNQLTPMLTVGKRF